MLHALFVPLLFLLSRLLKVAAAACKHACWCPSQTRTSWVNSRCLNSPKIIIYKLLSSVCRKINRASRKTSCSIQKRRKQFGFKHIQLLKTNMQIKLTNHVEDNIENVGMHQKRRKSICNPEIPNGKCILPKNIILVQNLHKNKRHAPKTQLFTSHTKFGCSSTIPHHFQSCSQPKRCRHQKKAARPNSYWVIAHVHHMHGSIYFHTPFCYELPVRQLPSSEAQKFARSMQICIFQSSINHCEDQHEVLSSRRLQMFSNYICTLIISCVALYMPILKFFANGVHAVSHITKETLRFYTASILH